MQAHTLFMYIGMVKSVNHLSTFMLTDQKVCFQIILQNHDLAVQYLISAVAYITLVSSNIQISVLYLSITTRKSMFLFEFCNESSIFIPSLNKKVCSLHKYKYIGSVHCTWPQFFANNNDIDLHLITIMSAFSVKT